MMKFLLQSLLMTILLMAISVQGGAQTDTTLLKRIDLMLKATQEIDIDKILDYTYPKVFDIAPREKIGEAIKEAFINEELTTTLDSLYVIKVHPTFKIANGEYAMIEHNMIMYMKFNNELNDNAAAQMISGMEEEFGKGNVRIDKKTNTVIVKNKSEVLAIKDEFCSDWMFVNYDEEGGMNELLFSDELIAKLNSYK